MPGPRRKPTVIKLVTGNPGGKPLNPQEPDYPVMDTASFADLPAELATDPIAAGEWRRLATMLAESRQVTEGDRSALIALCKHWSRFIRMEAKVTNNEILKGESGAPIVNPFLAVANVAYLNCARGWSLLGLVCTEKSKAMGGTGVAKSQLERFLASKRLERGR